MDQRFGEQRTIRGSDGSSHTDARKRPATDNWLSSPDSCSRFPLFSPPSRQKKRVNPPWTCQRSCLRSEVASTWFSSSNPLLIR